MVFLVTRPSQYPNVLPVLKISLQQLFPDMISGEIQWSATLSPICTAIEDYSMSLSKPVIFEPRV